MNELLDRPIYDLVQAAHLLNMSSSTLHWWLEGRQKYPPVLRETATGSRELTWGEFVEARYVAAYRRRYGVKLQHIREFIDRLRWSTDARHPLAVQQPWIGPGRRLLLAAQDDAGLEPALWSVYEPRSGQLLLTAPAQSFFDVVEFEDADNARSIVRRLHPAGRDSPVVIDPDLRAGLSSVGGIATTVIREMVGAGDSVESVAEDFGLTLDFTVAALAFERTLSRAA